VLTIAHLDHTPENNEPENLRAMCQGCHLHYDREHHAQTRLETLRREREAAGQLTLP
jgi:5-methylcytosine-specific restriction endonuclease McrA